MSPSSLTAETLTTVLCGRVVAPPRFVRHLGVLCFLTVPFLVRHRIKKYDEWYLTKNAHRSHLQFFLSSLCRYFGRQTFNLSSIHNRQHFRLISKYSDSNNNFLNKLLMSSVALWAFTAKCPIVSIGTVNNLGAIQVSSTHRHR